MYKEFNVSVVKTLLYYYKCSLFVRCQPHFCIILVVVYNVSFRVICNGTTTKHIIYNILYKFDVRYIL